MLGCVVMLKILKILLKGVDFQKFVVGLMSNSEKELFISGCSSGNLNQVKELLLEGIDPNFEWISLENNPAEAETALCITASKGFLEITKLLISYGANVNYRCKHGESALFLAVRNGHLKVSECLLKAGAKVAFTAKSEGNVFFENWEVFTQALKKVYPQDINDPLHSDYKAVIQLLLEYNANSPRPSTLYEVLYCSLTVFSNPIAVYCVGVYAELSCSQPTVTFSEENFLSALCHAFDFSCSLDFFNTVQSILRSNKVHQKDAAQSLVRHFNWSDLIRRVAEQSYHMHKPVEEFAQIARKLFVVFNQISSSFNVKSDIQLQFASLNSDSIAKIGRLIKFIFDLKDSSNIICDFSETWQFLFFMLKQYLRDGQKSNVARLLLKPCGYKETNGSHSKFFCSEYEKKILLKCVEEDMSLAHMLLDYGLVITGDCFVNFVKNGHVDLVDRCANEKELLFCKEVCELFQFPTVSVKNASNRNMRRCLKIIKNQRNAIEKARFEIEQELLKEGDESGSRISKKKQKQRAKKQQKDEDEIEPKQNGDAELNLHENGVMEAHFSQNDESEIDETQEYSETQTSLMSNFVHSFSNGVREIPQSPSSPPYTKQISTEDSEGTDDYQAAYFDKKNKPKSKSKKRKKNKKHHGRNKFPSVSGTSSDEKNDDFNSDDDNENETTSSDAWKELMLASSQRRRRQSSSSSDCSTGPKKSVHFSHPLIFYENTKGKKRLRKMPSLELAPKASNLKQTVITDQNFDISETYRTCQNGLANCADFDANIPWVPGSKRWSARFEDLSETEVETLKVMSMNGAKNDLKVYFCDKQKHLNVGSGPDFSSVFLGLTSQGKEVAIKRVGKKRSPLLSNSEEIEALLKLDDHKNVNHFTTVLKDKAHFYILQGVAEYTLDQIIRKKIISLPLSVSEACRQVVEGLHFLHKNNILHMNLKPSNVLLGVDNQLRLSDYGIHRREQTEEKRNPLAPTISCVCWMARESSIKGKSIFSKESDVQCLGMLFFYIITGGGHPFGNPDSLPGECVKNINKGTCNLASLDNPLAHDLVKNMLAKEAHKRSNLIQIKSHPFFWSAEDRDAYFALLIELALSGGITQEEQSFLELLEKFRHGILMTYVRKDLLVGLSEENVSSVESLMRFILSCMNNPDVFNNHAKLDLVPDLTTPASFFQTSFPGFLIQAHKVITWDDLENASLKIDISRLTQYNCDVMCNDMLDGEDVVMKSILGIVEEEDKQKATKSSNKQSSDSTFMVTTSATSLTSKFEDIRKSSKDFVPVINGKKNEKALESHSFASQDSFTEEFAEFGSLPLLEKPTALLGSDSTSSFTNFNLLPEYGREVEDAQKEDLSPSNHDENILLDCDWESYTKQQISDKTEDMKFHPSHNDVHVTSPDDWIDVGSPLESSCKIDCSAPVDLKKFFAGGMPDDTNSAGSSSSCSVDGCYDFDSYVQNWPGSPDALIKDPPLFHSNFSSTLHTGYTDIDELD